MNCFMGIQSFGLWPTRLAFRRFPFGIRAWALAYCATDHLDLEIKNVSAIRRVLLMIVVRQMTMINYSRVDKL